ncbi:uncharacterized protein [Lolium perenne]|uniref:uncharacterized protein n=1 Tax=Lolium perenne TaxID=4522 RepID=UPI0021F64191|nr:uncharacterized protein LOC127297192 [Lolium perenne]
MEAFPREKSLTSQHEWRAFGSRTHYKIIIACSPNTPEQGFDSTMRQGNINHHAVPLRQQWVDFRQGRPILCIMWYEGSDMGRGIGAVPRT